MAHGEVLGSGKEGILGPPKKAKNQKSNDFFCFLNFYESGLFLGRLPKYALRPTESYTATEELLSC